MKILAVIPARAGSRGIPNKNFRLINDKPLIVYSIKNAQASKYITDIIVTTDSPIIETIAKNQSVSVHLRNPSLCGDDITLDAVIYDAQQTGCWDYVITLQPTSPTLTARTLDLAIAYAISNNFDSVISVTNQPHLAWKLSENGQIIPAYKQRLNRQYLPPYFKETGAFVISKGSCIKPNSRLGNHTGVYEIPENEAIDIDTFSDLKVAESILTQRNVAFYVNGNNNIGLGHIYRVLELADEFYCKPDIYYNKQLTTESSFGNTTHNLIPVNNESDLFEKIRHKKYGIFINDILSTSSSYMSHLKSALSTNNTKIINIEDDGDGACLANLVINALYNHSVADNEVSGEKYYIAPKLFLIYKKNEIRATVSNIFICFGGADPQNYTEAVLDIITKNYYKNYSFTVVLGRAKANVKSIFEKYGKYSNIRILYDVPNMPALMLEHDIAITSRGRTAFELALLGIPTISIAQNDREMMHSFISPQNGFEFLGFKPPMDTLEKIIQTYLMMSKESRELIQNKLLSHDLRGGRSRVMHLIRSI